MKLYQLTFMDLSDGKQIRFRSSKLARDKLVREWKIYYPLRTLMLAERIEIPDGKIEFVDWLNQHEAQR